MSNKTFLNVIDFATANTKFPVYFPFIFIFIYLFFISKTITFDIFFVNHSLGQGLSKIKESNYKPKGLKIYQKSGPGKKIFKFSSETPY